MDRFKHPNQNLLSLLKDRLGMTDADFAQKQCLGDRQVETINKPTLDRSHLEQLSAIVGPENAASDDYSRVKYSTGKSAKELLLLRKALLEHVADLVLHPRHKKDVEAIVSYCHLHKIPIIAYGGGSSVTLGLTPEKKGVILVMQTHMHKVLSFNETNQTVTVEPGIMGPDYEHALNNAPTLFGAHNRYTGGHFPQSFEHSSVGGWILTLGSGQQSSYYGDMNDLVMSLEVVAPTGFIRTLAYPATATGPKVCDILKGSEGAFGVLVSATLKVFRHLPENRKRFSFIFPDWHKTVDAARAVFQEEFGYPSVFRISDPEETHVAMKLYGIDRSVFDKILTHRGYKPGERCLLIGQADGEKGFASHVKHKVKRTCRQYGGMYLTELPVKNWAESRFTDPYLREDLNDFGIVIDTLETTVPWDEIHRVHQGVRNTIKKRPNTICMTHASHFYPQGTNLYFIFISRIGDLHEYTQFQEDIIESIYAWGGSLSHHHGVGRLMTPWMERHLGKQQMDVLRALKKHFDPNNIMNPGCLI